MFDITKVCSKFVDGSLDAVIVICHASNFELALLPHNTTIRSRTLYLSARRMAPHNRKRGTALVRDADHARRTHSMSGEPPATRQRLSKDDSGGHGLPPRPQAARRASSPARAPSAGPSASLSFLPYPNPATQKPRSVPFQQPSQLISFSYDSAHTQAFTDAELKYYADPPAGADLNYGYERWVRRDDERGRLDALLRAIAEVKARGKGKEGGALPQIGVVSWRGIITKCVSHGVFV